MSEYDTKMVLLDLMKEGENRICMDCDTPMPQWCSLTYAVYLCLGCSGVHRSLGTHISFVRSLTMDKWTPIQIAKMQAGGNAKAREFFEAGEGYGGKNMPIADKYATHFASQYKEKLAAEVAGEAWTPSAAPAPSSALRKPRVGALTGASRGISSSSMGNSSNDGGYNQPAALTQKEKNENYFATMGASNATRRDDIAPSQGGKYGGFGSGGVQPGQGGGYGGGNSLSSSNLPRLDDFTADPVSALGKGWGFMSAALGAASRTINETVVTPAIQAANDPNLQNSLGGYAQRAAAIAAAGARAGASGLASGLDVGSDLIKRETGFDVGDLGASALQRATGTGRASGGTGGYSAVGSHQAPEAGGEDDFFGAHLKPSGRYEGFGNASSNGGSSGLPSRETTPQLGYNSGAGASGGSRIQSGRASPAVQPVPVSKAASKKKDDDWDEW